MTLNTIYIQTVTIINYKEGGEIIYVNVTLPLMAPRVNNIPPGETFTIIVTTSRNSLSSVLPCISPPAGGDTFL